MNKVELRKTIRQQRRQLSTELQSKASEKMCEHVLASPEFQSSQTIAAYLAVHGEIDPQQLLHAAWEMDKQCYVPVLINDLLHFARYQADSECHENAYGILEPTADELIAPDELDLILCPLVAFDQQGHRVGMGKGHYDKALAKLGDYPPPYLIGVAYAFQEVDAITHDEWDVNLTGVCTEVAFYRFD